MIHDELQIQRLAKILEVHGRSGIFLNIGLEEFHSLESGR